MKNRTSGLVKQVIASLRSLAKSKTMALKSRTNAIKARLIIFTLLNKRFLMSSISEKFQSVLGHHSHPSKEECLLEDGSDQNNAIARYNDNAFFYEAVPNPSETQVVEDKDEDGHESYNRYGVEEEDDVDDGKYPDLNHPQNSEGLDLGGSVIDLVKNSKEEAGQEFKMEDEIDHMADLFIKKFRDQILLQKQESIKRQQEMLLRVA